MNRPGRPELLLTLTGLALPAMLASPLVHGWSEDNVAVHHALHWAVAVDGVLLGLIWAPRLVRLERLAVPALLLGSAVQLVAHLPPLWVWAIVEPFSHGALHLVILGGGFLVGAGYGLMRSVGRAWFVLGALVTMTPLTLAMIAGAISYPPYPVSESEAAGVVMLLAMQSIWLFALPGSGLLRVARARSTPIFACALVVALVPWIASAAV